MITLIIITMQISIDELNFLKYNEQVWEKKYNHKSHYQNRLRHSEYKNLLIKTGFKIVKEKILKRSQTKPKINIKYKNFATGDLIATRGYFLAVKI